ncbi:unnamed protein product [Spirodela intermedia]|uniref:Uncharacterized protein n=1 Tax=Spirodela intermedia TaxID=51605 RepID=A0A7I8IVL7_SPIIN|nr:unnamed protein product [Spirodela intermedia]CAA6661908.1 unnamed protein product [Spirodela intermedia]
MLACSRGRSLTSGLLRANSSGRRFSIPHLSRGHQNFITHKNHCTRSARKKKQTYYQALDQFSSKTMLPRKKAIGENISSRDKSTFLLNALINLNDSREAVYGTLDGWVAWERSFPLVSLKRILITLEKEEQWHRVVQVIKWMLSKGQGRTMGTYEQLIRALEKDHRAEEAHRIWLKKIGSDIHSVPWRVCDLMVSIYYRNNMLERLIKLFKALESFDRKSPSKSIVQKVADAYEMMGSSEEKNRVLEKYSSLFSEAAAAGHPRKPRRAVKKPVMERKNGKNSIKYMPLNIKFSVHGGEGAFAE